jgi:hypothetical protein
MSEKALRERSRSRVGRGLRVGVAAVATAALAAMTLAPASAAPGTVTGATFEWKVSELMQRSATFGGCHYMSTGRSEGNEATYQASSGNAAIVKSGATPTWAGRCTLVDNKVDQKVVFSGGTGTLDPTTGETEISFTGTVSLNMMGGTLPFWIEDPVLTVDADGNGTMRARLGGFSSSQANPGVKTPIDPVEDVLVATFGGVDSDNTVGFTTTPQYAGVLFDVPEGKSAAPQNRTNPGWGAWPAPFVNFHFSTGLTSYWYSSGGGADPNKPPAPLTVAYGTFNGVPQPATPSISVSPGGGLVASDGNTVTVTGADFTLPPDAQGVYVFLTSADQWQPGQAPPGLQALPAATFVPAAQIVGGIFTTQLAVPAGTVTDVTKTFGGGTTCAHGCAATNRGLDTFAPVTFVTAPGGGGEPGAPDTDDLTISATVVQGPGDLGSFSWTIDADDRAVVLSNAVDRGAYLQSTGALKPVKITDTRSGAPSWSVSGQVSDFTGGLSGKYLGWTPNVTTPGAGATAGDAVATGIDSGNGLKDAAVLASATTGHGLGTAVVGADLDLRIPAGTAPGTYTATLTLTALS